ncbi:hypothetical protein IMY05_C3108000400 [Salix suchowensis]|nr:hypothetical protein IMY05_C3108000400 [Salix suchowensis]
MYRMWRGMKPEAVYDHFTKSHPVNVPSFKDVPAKLESRTVHHHMNLGKRPAHLKQLQKKLQDMGSQQLAATIYRNGLQIRPGCICPCGHANSTTEAFRKHSKCKVFEERACYLQSYHPSNYAEWFEVRPQTTPDVTIIPGVVFTPVEQLFRERQAQLYSLVPLLGVMKDSFLDTEGIDQLLTKYNKISLYNCTNAGANDPVRKRLISLRQDTLFADVELLGKSHSSITYPFIDCSLRTKPAKEFRASPQKKTLRAYVTPQEQFICTLVHHHRTPIKAISSDELLFDLTAEEKLAIEELILALRLKELPECLSPMQRSWACQKMYELLYIFYFPRKDPKYLAGGFKFPLVTFLATSWLTPDGAYKMISNFPPVLAKCQFMMRLVGFHKMMVPLEEMMKLPMTVVKDLPEEEEEEEELDFRPRRRQINLPSVLSSLYDDQPQTEREVATKALVRDLLHKATWVVRNTPRPAVITTIDDAVGTFRYDGQVFTLPQLKATVQREMAHLEESIASGVLIGEDLAALGIDFDLFLVEDSGDETTPGYGIFGKTNNPDSSTLMDAFIKKETFKDLENPKSQRYDEDKVQNWILEVEHAWGLLYPLIHILSGPPARGTEEASFTVCNLSGGRRHLFMADYEGERLLTIRSDYHKGLRTTSLVKEIWRVLPYGLARVLYVLLHLIRPIEMVLACDYIIPEDKVALAAAEYTSGLYVHRGKRWTLAGCRKA